MSDTYTCEQCGGTFEKGWSDEESAAEAQSIWGDLSTEDVALICEDCWQQIRPDRVPTDAGILEMWLNARKAWTEHSGREVTVDPP